VQGHSFDRSFSEILPSESDIFRQLLERASMNAIALVDVHFNLSPRHLRSDGSQFVKKGIQHALAGTRLDWQLAENLWSRAFDMSPDSAAVNYNLGAAAEIREDYDMAVSYYENARRLSGLPEAFKREIVEASRSADVLAVFGSSVDEGKLPAAPQKTQEEKKAESQEESQVPSGK
jgi:hypothetical protein